MKKNKNNANINKYIPINDNENHPNINKYIPINDTKLCRERYEEKPTQ
jgi:hypothetical protein